MHNHMVKPSADGNLQSLHNAKLLSAFHCVCNPINVITSFRNAGIVLQLGEDGTSMAGVDTEAHWCYYPLIWRRMIPMHLLK
jgi:hypothetical protein